MSHRSRLRRAFTLVELGVVLATLTVLFAVLTMFLATLLQAQWQTRQRDQQRRELARLDAILRSDVHAATTLEVKSPTDCELKNESGQRWTYRLNEGNLLRERWSGGQRMQQEIFQLAAESKVAFGMQIEGSRHLLQLELNLQAAPTPRAGRFADYRGQMLVGGGLLAAPSRAEDEP